MLPTPWSTRIREISIRPVLKGQQRERGLTPQWLCKAVDVLLNESFSI